MLCSEVFSSRTAASCSIFAFSSRFSSSLRSPPARATLRSSCWRLNSAAYSSSCCRTTLASSSLILCVRFLFWLWPPAISAMRSRSEVRIPNSSWLCLNISSFKSVTSFWPRFTRSSSSAWMLCSSLVFFSMESRLENSSRRASSTAVYFLRASSSFRLRSATSARRPMLVAFWAASSLATFCSVFFRTFTSSLSSATWKVSSCSMARRLPTPRSAICTRASTSLLLAFSCSRNLAFSSKLACFSRISIFLCANASLAAAMSPSRRFMLSTASSHCRTRFCRSSCNRRKSSAVLSSWIWEACVSVTSPSSSVFLRFTFLVSFSMCRLSSLTRASSARLYFSMARLSSSFWRDANAHCSNSSWFQFISSLN
mmetsp:Transcript_5128/g.9692  ORF Transcript_5128/g.9692 Transcript_5128/m.9692 type:complete len:370 (-) Transcript_5128:597-1706(-)